MQAALGGNIPATTSRLDVRMLLDTRRQMSPAGEDQLDVVALGSPHFSISEFRSLLALLDGRRASLPIYVCTGRHVIDELEARGWLKPLEQMRVTLIVDTCVVVTPVLQSAGGVLMTNSGKFAHYSKSLTGHDVVFGSLEECVESAIAGRVVRQDSAWGAA